MGGHNALVHYCMRRWWLQNRHLQTVFRGAKSADRRHRRAACVVPIRGAREKVFFREIIKLADLLLAEMLPATVRKQMLFSKQSCAKTRLFDSKL